MLAPITIFGIHFCVTHSWRGEFPLSLSHVLHRGIGAVSASGSLFYGPYRSTTDFISEPWVVRERQEPTKLVRRSLEILGSHPLPQARHIAAGEASHCPQQGLCSNSNWKTSDLWPRWKLESPNLTSQCSCILSLKKKILMCMGICLH